MKVYKPEAKHSASHTVHITPGSTDPANCPREWFREDGTAIMHSVTFKYGEADVHGRLGRYLIDNKLAQSSPLILPT